MLLYLLKGHQNQEKLANLARNYAIDIF